MQLGECEAGLCRSRQGSRFCRRLSALIPAALPPRRPTLLPDPKRPGRVRRVTAAVVTGGSGAYLASMTASRLLRLLAMFALLLMPLAMAGQGHAVAAAPHGEMASAEAGHCADIESEGDRKHQSGSAAADCLMACAALPAAGAPVAAEQIVLRPTPVAALQPAIVGLSPEAETPPPRIA